MVALMVKEVLAGLLGDCNGLRLIDRGILLFDNNLPSVVDILLRSFCPIFSENISEYLVLFSLH